MNNKFVSLVLVDRESSKCDDVWGRGFKGVTHIEFETVQDARLFFLEQNEMYAQSTRDTRFVLIPYIGKK